MTLTKHGKTGEGKYELTVTFSAEEFNNATERVYRREKNKIALPGFRKGKAPRKMIERMYGESFFYEDAINDLLPNAFNDAVKEADIEFIGRPDVDVNSIDKENGVTVTYTVELRPELKVKKYKGLSAHREDREVEESEVDAEIKRLSEKVVREVEIEDRAAENGDIANIDFKGFVGDTAFEGGEGKDYDLELGSGTFIPGFEDQIVGKNAGDEFDVNVKFPEEYGSEDLAGKDAKFEVKLNAIRKKEYPEIDDEFAKDVSDYDTLDELKKSIREDLKKRYDTAADNMFEDELADALVKETEGDIPEAMIEARIDDMLRDFTYRMAGQGLTMENYMKFTGQTAEQVREGLREQAERAVRMRLALEAVAREENFEVTDEDVTAEIDRMAEQYEMDADTIRNMITAAEIRSDIKTTKALDFIKENAKITKPKKTAAKPTVKKTTKKAKEPAEEAPAEEKPAEETAPADAE